MEAVYYDGKSAHAHQVTLAIDGDMFVVTGETVARRDPMGAVQIMEPLGRSPRVVRLIGNASCEVDDVDGFAAFLRRSGIADSKVASWDRSWRVVVTAVVAIALFAVMAYRFGLPVLAEQTANRLPATALNTLSWQIQGILDKTVFSPTQIPQERRDRLQSEFMAMRLPEETRHRLFLEFRRADGIGANAMALPSGTIFVTDALVEAMPNDRLILAVLAHEAGHVHRRHGLRNIIQSTVMGALVTWYIGDVSGLAAGAPTAVLQAKYSRDLEREADAYAADLLVSNGMPPALLIDALEALEKSREASGRSAPLPYLSSHPATEERIAWLRGYGK